MIDIHTSSSPSSISISKKMTTSTAIRVSVLFAIMFYASPVSSVPSPKRSVLTESNSDLPFCRTGSSCGYLQLNGRGISVEETCRCPHPNQYCPLTWDPFDGQTVVHGNDHYKYCEQTPQLEPCKKGQLVYTAKHEFSATTMMPVVTDHRLHCICPGNYMFLKNSTDIKDVDGEITQLTVTHICVPPPRCAHGESCMTITESAESSFVTRTCRCPRGSFCPRDLRLASSRVETRRGAFYLMECQ